MSAERIGHVVALPRDRNPYQELLYSQMRRLGYKVTYLGELTSSRSLNLLLMPLELGVLRMRGRRILHLHWTFGFSLPGAGRIPGLRWLARIWFQVTLLVARACGYRIVWTAHNLLPQAQVFDNDRAARGFLVSHTDLVIAHSQGALDEVRASFGDPRTTAVIPHGPIEPPGLAETPCLRGTQPRRVLFFGRVDAYKGVEDLLEAAALLHRELELQVVGHCSDPALASELTRRAERLNNVTMSLCYVPDEDIRALFEEADAVVYPYRKVTTSGSVTLAAVAGRPIIAPDLPGFANLPDAAVIRYRQGVDGLATALTEVATAEVVDLQAKAAAAKEILAGISWDSIAARTSVAFEHLFSE